MRELNIEKFTISRNDGFMEGWPDMIKLQTGRILVVYNECTAHSNRNGTHITMRLSDDNGITWSEKQYIGEETQHGDQWNSIRVNQLKNGNILLVCDRIHIHEKTGETKLYAFESRDNGETWSEKRDLGIFGYCSDKVRELSDGSLLLCVSRYNEALTKTEVFAHKSFDGGAHWTPAVTVASSSRYTFIEPAALELQNGTVAIFLRENSQCGYNGFVVFSHDLGSSFTAFREIPIKGMHRPFVGYLENGTILLSYREHLAAGQPYPDLKLCLFSQQQLLQPEQTPWEIHWVDHDRSDVADQGYSAWVPLSANRILMANYIVDDAPKAYIRGYRIEIGERIC